MRFALITISLLFSVFAHANAVRGLLQANRLEEGLAICRQYEVLKNADSDADLACAWIYFRTNHTPLAEKILQKNKKKSYLPEYQMLNAYSKIVNKKYDDADVILQQVINNNKRTKAAVNATALRAEIKEIRDQLPSAAFIYTGVVREDPTNGRAHWTLGRHYKNRGDIRLAIQHLETTTKLWPKHVESRLELALLYLDHGGPESVNDATKWLSAAYHLNKADPRVLEQLGVVFEKQGKVNEAVRYWQKALEINKDQKLASLKLQEYFAQAIDTLIDAKKWHAALMKLETAGPKITDQPKYLIRRAIVRRNLGQYEKAAVDFQLYLKSNAADGTAMRELGICYLNMNQAEQAYTYFMKAIAQEPDNGLNHAWYAFLLEGKGELERANEEWHRAVDLLKDPVELRKANRKLASIEKRIVKKRKIEAMKQKEKEAEREEE